MAAPERMLPGAWLAAWLNLCVLLAFAPAPLVWGLAGFAAAAAAWCRPALLGSTLRRMGWLLLSLMAVMAWTTPGDALFDARWAPTRQGLAAGATQAARLLCAVLAVRAIIAASPRPALLGAFYQAFRPLSRLGFPADTLAVRLWLTLDAVDALGRVPFRSLWARLGRALDQDVAVSGPDRVELLLCKWRTREWCVVAVCVLVSGWTIARWG